MFCAFCGDSRARLYPGYPFARCDLHSTTPPPKDFGGLDPQEVLRRVHDVPPDETVTTNLGALDLSPDLSVLTLGGTRYGVARPDDLCARMGIPWGYFRRDAAHTPGLREAMLRNQLDLHRDAGVGLRLRRSPEWPPVVTFEAPRESPPIRAADALQCAFEVFRRKDLYHDRLVEKYDCTSSHSTFYLLTRVAASPVSRAGDVLAAGVSIDLNGSVQVQQYAVRRVCSNGLTSRDCKHGERSPIRSLEDLDARVEAVLDTSVGEFLPDLMASDRIIVRDLLAALRPTLADRQIPRVVRSRLRRSARAVGEHPLTAFDIANLITVVRDGTPGNASRLGLHAGDLVARTVRAERRRGEACEMCGQALDA